MISVSSLVMKTLFVLFLCASVITLVIPVDAQDKPARIPAGYSVEKIETPKGVSLGVGGMEFAPDGSLILCTREGEVWKYVISSKQWSLFADGLHESLGVWIDPKTGETYVIQRGEITKLIDTNGDGRSDKSCYGW